MSDDAGERRRRIQALREKVTGSKPTLKFRNYRPNDATIKEKLGAAGGTDVAGSAHKAGAEKGAGEDQQGSRKSIVSGYVGVAQCPTTTRYIFSSYVFEQLLFVPILGTVWVRRKETLTSGEAQDLTFKRTTSSTVSHS